MTAELEHKIIQKVIQLVIGRKEAREDSAIPENSPFRTNAGEVKPTISGQVKKSEF